MKFIDNQGITDPRVNLAIEEFVLKHLPLEEDSYLLFYINEPSIIIGKTKIRSKKSIAITSKRITFTLCAACRAEAPCIMIQEI